MPFVDDRVRRFLSQPDTSVLGGVDDTLRSFRPVVAAPTVCERLSAAGGRPLQAAPRATIWSSSSMTAVRSSSAALALSFMCRPLLLPAGMPTARVFA